MKLSSNYLFEIVNQSLQVLVPIITLPYIAKVLGADNVGISSYTLSIVTLFSTFALLGINIYGNRAIAAHRADRERSTSIFWSVFLIKAASTILCIFAYLIFSLKATYPHKTILFLQIFNLVAIGFDITWLFAGFEDFYRITIRNVIVRFAGLASILLLVKTGKDLSIYILIAPLVTILGHLLLWPKIKHYIDSFVIQAGEIKHHLVPIFHLFISQAAIQIYTSLDKTIAGLIAGDKVVGVYDYAQRICKISMIIISSLGTIMMPRISNLWAKKETAEISRYLQASLLVVAFFAFPIFFGIIATSKPLIAVFLPYDFQKVSTLMILMSPCILLWAINNITGFQILIPTGNEKYLTYSVIVGAATSALLNFILIRKIGINGAAITCTLTEGIVTAIQVYFVLRTVKIEWPIKELFSIVIASLGMFGVILSFSFLNLNNIGIISIQLIAGIIIYFSICSWTKVSTLARVLVEARALVWKIKK